MIAQAQITNYLGLAPGASLDAAGIFRIIAKLSCWFIRFGIVALGVMIIVFGLLFMASRGNSTQLSSAKKALGWGIVGGLVIMGVFTIILTIPALLGTINGTQVDYPIMKILNNCS